MSSPSRQHIQVLHVDDNPDLSELLATHLQREDDRVALETATNTDEGLQRLAAGNFDCIVSEYQLPGMDGIEFLKTSTEEYPTLPFILYTDNGSETVASDAISAGAADY